MLSLAPIVLFAYARPEHVRQTLNALSANALADQSDLVVYADAARSEQDSEAVHAVRELIRGVSGFRSVLLIERTTNYGLARNIIEGVSEVLCQNERVIVLEDDMVTSPLFLTFMNEALDRYCDNDDVMHISGYNYPMRTDGLPETFFLPPASCWGWATWARAWQHFSKNPSELVSVFSTSQRQAFNLDGAFPFWTQVMLNAQGRMNTWAVFWYASIFRREGLCLHPRQSYVQNIGHDDSGTHTSQSSAFDVVLNSCRVESWCETYSCNDLALTRLKTYFRSVTSFRVKARMLCETILCNFQHLSRARI